MSTRFAMIAVVIVAVSRATAGVAPLDPNSDVPIREQITRMTHAPPTGPTTQETLIA